MKEPVSGTKVNYRLQCHPASTSMRLLNRLYNLLPIMMFFKYAVTIVGIYILATRHDHDSLYVFWALEVTVVLTDLLTRLMFRSVDVVVHNIATVLYYAVNLLNLIVCLVGIVALARTSAPRPVELWATALVLTSDCLYGAIFLSAVVYSVVFITRLQREINRLNETASRDMDLFVDDLVNRRLRHHFGLPMPVVVPSKTYSSDVYRLPFQKTCGVCHVDFADGNDINEIDKCRHVFHSVCLAPWIAVRNTCPMCRTLISDEVIPDDIAS
jgi:hypothetical protein